MKLVRCRHARRSRTGAGLTATASVVFLLVATLVSPAPARAAAGEVLILGSTVSGGMGSIEAQEVTVDGLTPVVIDDRTWQSLTTAQFASYRALILGDPRCTASRPAAAEANAATWGAAVTGNVLINGTDPVFHSYVGGELATRRFVDFAVANTSKTGLYVSLSCSYDSTAAHTPVAVLDALRPGGFTVTGVGCWNNAHIVATHPALVGLSDATLSNWSCSVHEAFDSYPPDFQVLAMARNIGSTFTASDGSVGTPYILASGSGLRSFPLSLSPASGTDAAGGSHTVTATLLDKGTALPVSGRMISFAVTAGPNTGVHGSCSSSDCATGGDGTVSWTYASNSKNGTDTIAAWIDQDGNGAISSGEPQTYAAEDWVGPAISQRYVALGDSFQSGEGAYHYVGGTDSSGDRCHRSSISYPYLIKGADGVPPAFTDVACSGAEIKNLINGQNGEAPQYAALGPDVRLVTIGIGGNDLDFAGVIRRCVLGPPLPGHYAPAVTQTCHGREDQGIRTKMAALDTPVYDSADGAVLTPLQHVYNKIKQRAPRARIIVLGYPHLFNPSGNFFGCNLVARSDEKWIDSKIDDFNTVIARNAATMGAEYTSGSSAFDGHELCGEGPEYLNGIVGLGDSESFHPNDIGHVQLAEIVLGTIKGPAAGTGYIIRPKATTTISLFVQVGTKTTTVGINWPGSDIELSLTDPTGHTYTRDTTDSHVFHQVGPTSELYTITNPAPGTWKVNMYGADVDPAGEKAQLVTTNLGPENQPPSAVGHATANAAGTTVAYDAAGSFDPDGTIASYEWDFGDGTVATGQKATHTYSNLGHLNQPTLIVTDNDGAQAYTDLPDVVVHYGFAGFFTPIVDSKATVHAGATLPVKWQLTQPDGSAQNNLSAVSSYTASKSGATFSLANDGAQYNLHVKTPKSWANSTVTFTLTFNDQSVHTVAIKAV